MKTEETLQRLTGQLNQVNSIVGDADALQLAEKILQLKPRNRATLEKIMVIFLDNKCIAEARETMNLLASYYSHKPYWYVFKANIAYLENNYAVAMKEAKDGLSESKMENWQRALLFDIMGRIYLNWGEAEQAMKVYLASCRLPDNPGACSEYSNAIFSAHYLEMPQHDILAMTKKYEKLLAAITPYRHNNIRQHDKIRIGYMSADFNKSVVSIFCMCMFAGYDKSRFKVYVYAKCAEDYVSMEIKKNIDVWRNITSLSHREAAEVIYNDEIDILFDVSGHTGDNCLPVMAYKPAPVQLSGIGWFDTTGLSTIDYFLTDVHVDPVGENDAFFTEKLLRMPQSHFCWVVHEQFSAVSPAPFKKNGFITFGTLNKYAKISDRMLALWAKILHRVPESRLLLKSSVFDEAEGREKAMARIMAAGIDKDRLITEGFTADYLQAYHKIDIALDTYPYPGGATTCDALYAGVPVVTLVGTTHNSRFGYSILKNLGLKCLCAGSDEEYVDICVKLAENKDYLAELHMTLRHHMRISPVMDMGAYMQELELIYERIAPYRKYVPTMEDLLRWEEEAEWDRIIKGGNTWLAAMQGTPQESMIWGLVGEAYLYRDTSNAERAKYCLLKAIQDKQVPYRLRFLCYLSEAADKVKDYLQSYNSIHEAASLLDTAEGKKLPQEWIYNIHISCGFASLMFGYYKESEKEYYQAVKSAHTFKARLDAMSSYLLASHFLPNSTEEIFKRQQEYGRMVSVIKKLPAITTQKKVYEKIRIGYLSPDFRRHAMFPIIYGLFVCHNREKFTVTGYQLNPKSDNFTTEIRNAADEWCDISAMTHEEAAQKIREDGIDILVELASHAKSSGLPILAYRPARVHISGLGSLCSTGMKEVDYYITDAIVDPPGMHDAFFTEKPLYLPAQFGYTGRNDVPVPVGTPCKEKGFIMFGVIQVYSKITDEMLLAWKKILESLPTARLLIKSVSFGGNSLTIAAYKRLQNLGLPMERIILEAGDNEYMQRLLDVDILLDTYPYTGGSTSLDALYMGVPVVTRYGERRNTRFCYSILKSIGLEELAVQDVTSYIDTALNLAGDVELLDLLHKNIRRMMTDNQVMSPQGYTKNLEQAYLKMAVEYEMFAEGNNT